MKVNCIATDTLALAVTPIGDRLYKIACDTKVSVQTDEGVFLFKFLDSRIVKLIVCKVFFCLL